MELIKPVFTILMDGKEYGIAGLAQKIADYFSTSKDDANCVIEESLMKLKSLDQRISILMMEIVLTEFAKTANGLSPFNVNYSALYSITDKGIEFYQHNKDSFEVNFGVTFKLASRQSMGHLYGDDKAK